ncbi:hypothetical protein RQN30_01210 [Arcanobacterium hippocoleae]
MTSQKPQVIILTGAPGAGGNEVAFAFQELGLMAADAAGLTAHSDADSSLKCAVETGNYELFDAGMARILQALFTDIETYHCSCDLQNRDINTADTYRADKKIQYVILVPAIAFLERLCPESSSILASKLTAASVSLTVLNADISKLIVRNHLFGGGNGLLMPRRILREQVADFANAVKIFHPTYVDTTSDFVPSKIAAEILASH